LPFQLCALPRQLIVVGQDDFRHAFLIVGDAVRPLLKVA
jgi:hypothetical protein